MTAALNKSSRRTIRELVVWLIALTLSVWTSRAIAAENVWSTETLNSRKAEWDQLIGPTIRVEGRISSQGKGQLRLTKCELVFHVTDSLLRLHNGKRSVELVGKFKKENGKVSFEVSQIQAVPTDVEQFDSRSNKLRNPRPTDWYELGEWASERSRFFDDGEMAKKAIVAFTHGVKLEWRALAQDDGEGRIQLAHTARDYKLPADLCQEIRHEGYHTLWHSALKRVSPDPALWSKLATRLADELPGSTTALAQIPPELKQRYERETLTLYRESNEATRQQLHRLFYVAVMLKSIEATAAADGRDGNLIADRIAEAVPEETALIEKYRDAKLAWRAARAATATRKEIELLASDYRARQQPALARQALQTWLKGREAGLRADGSLGLLQLADDYLALLQDEVTAATFLKEAHSLDPSLEEANQRLVKLGYKLERGVWTKEAATSNPAGTPKPEVTSPGGIAVGMKASVLRGLLGRPESTARVITSSGLVEVWSYGVPGSSRLIVHLERSGSLGEPMVIEFGNER